LLTLSNGGKQCAVFHEKSGSTMIFQVNFYKIGQKVQRSFGVFSIETGRWSLYANKTTGVAEIQMDAEEAWLVPLIQDEDGRMVETWAMECRNGLYYTTDASVSKTPVAVEYGPQLVSGSAIFLAFKLGVTDIYSKSLPTAALQKTSSQKTTVEGAFFAHFAPRASLCRRVLPASAPSSNNVCALCVRCADMTKGTGMPLSWRQGESAQSAGGSKSTRSTSAASARTRISGACRIMPAFLSVFLCWSALETRSFRAYS
jgi:hypothetical protein